MEEMPPNHDRNAENILMERRTQTGGMTSWKWALYWSYRWEGEHGSYLQQRVHTELYTSIRNHSQQGGQQTFVETPTAMKKKAERHTGSPRTWPPSWRRQTCRYTHQGRTESCESWQSPGDRQPTEPWIQLESQTRGVKRRYNKHQ